MQTGKAPQKQRKKNANFKRNPKAGGNPGNAVQIPDNMGYFDFDFNEPSPAPRNNPNRNRKMKGVGNHINIRQQQPPQQQNRPNRGGMKKNMNGNGWGNRGMPGPMMHPNPNLPPPLMMPNMNFRNRNRPLPGPRGPIPLMSAPMRIPPMPPINGRFPGRIPPPMMMPPPPMPRMMRSLPFNPKFNNNKNKPIKKNLSKVDKTKTVAGARKNFKNNKKRNNNKNKNQKKNSTQNQYSLEKPWVTDEIKAEHEKKESLMEQLKGNKNDQLFAEFKQQRELFVLKYDEAKKTWLAQNKVSSFASLIFNIFWEF